jgi:hypothetical protein
MPAMRHAFPGAIPDFYFLPRAGSPVLFESERRMEFSISVFHISKTGSRGLSRHEDGFSFQEAVFVR